MNRRLARISWNLCAPEYIFHPFQLFHRIKLAYGKAIPFKVVHLHWGLDIRVNSAEMIGRSIVRKKIYEVTLTETVWRLLDEGETALDIGAHVGYLTSAMAARVGGKGTVIAFEPHPILFDELLLNVERWNRLKTVGHISPHRVAVSDIRARGVMGIPPDWETNRGLAFVITEGEPDLKHSESFPIQRERLDALLDENVFIGLAKIDVERHEVDVLRGAEGILRGRRIRDVVFEDFGSYPTPAMRFLETFGYRIFSLAKGLRGPRLCPPDRTGVRPWDDPNYLATLDPDRTIARMRKKGWAVLKGRRTHKR